MIGKRFGRWLVIKEVKTSKPHKRYECKCDCGIIKSVSGTTLRCNKSQQCRNCAHNIKIKPTDMIGNKFGKYYVINFSHKKGTHKFYNCRCDCGVEKVVRGASLTARNSGCIKCSSRFIHGLCGTRIYNTWKSMIERCNNPTSWGYKYYGGRGIKICDRWLDIINFVEDMGERPQGKTLDRIDNDGHYSKENCRWMTPKEQANNRRVCISCSHLVCKKNRENAFHRSSDQTQQIRPSSLPGSFM